MDQLRQPEEPTVRRFVNPVTQTTYRLRVASSRWRLTKARSADGSLVLRHLRGAVSTSPIPQDLLTALIRGETSLPETLGDPVAGFGALVVWDLDRTCDVLVAMVREALQRSEHGAPGFRPSSPHLRRQLVEAQAMAERGCRAMAAAWSSAHLSAVIPEWLRAAIADANLPLSAS